MYTESDNEYWTGCAKALGAEFKPREYWYSPKNIRFYKNVKLIFDSYCHTSTSGIHSFESFDFRVCATFNSDSYFHFKISKSNLISKLSNWLFKDGFKTGERDFDKQFAIKTNDGFLLDKILQEGELRHLLLSLQEVNLEIGNNEGIWGNELPDGKLELSYYCKGRTIELNEVVMINTLFEKIIDKLHTMKIIKNHN